MKPKSGAGIVCYVKDIAKTVEFYEQLGFECKLKESTRATGYLNWWWIEFHEINATDAPPWHVSPDADNADIGALFYFSVDNVPRAYDELSSKGLHPSNEPVDLRGNKEFMIIDPDGYRLVFFKRKWGAYPRAAAPTPDRGTLGAGAAAGGAPDPVRACLR